MPLSAVKPEQYDALLAAKTERVKSLLGDLIPAQTNVFPSDPTAYRMRAEFRIWHEGEQLDYVMFHPEDRKKPVAIEHFPVACETIQTLMPALREILQANSVLRHKLFQAEFLSTLAGESVITLIYHRKLDAEWQQQAETLRTQLQTLCPGLSLIGRSRKQKRVLGTDWVTERFTIHGREYQYQQYEQAFTQPNAGVNAQMIQWACERASQLDGDLLELYCGNGNFTLPLAAHFKDVIATELAKISVRAARENIAANGVENVQIIRLAAEEVTQAMNGERPFRRLAELPKPLQQYDLRTVFVDPPRAGLDDSTTAMVSQFESIIYISCNPQTLAENLQTLNRTHVVEHFAMFDQFPYTDHMECGALLVRRTA